MIIEFSAREWEWYMLFDLMRIIESTDFDRLSGNDRRRTEWTDLNIKSINNVNCSQDGKPRQQFLLWKWFPLIL